MKRTARSGEGPNEAVQGEPGKTVKLEGSVEGAAGSTAISP